MTHRRTGLTLRIAAAALLLSGATGGAYLATERLDRSSPQAPSPASAEVDAALRQRVVEVHERVDRRRRQAIEDVVAHVNAESAQQRPSHAEAPATRPAPRPEPTVAHTPTSQAPRPTAPTDVPADCDQYSDNRALGCALLLETGYGMEQMSCLDNLWTRESGWNHRAQNPSSGAYGIPQALPGNKMATHGDDWQTNPTTQIRWGLSYIDNRYGTPCGAWDFFLGNGWY